MTRSISLADRFREVIFNGTFIANTNYRHQLSGTGLDLVTATAGPHNTIAVLAQHIHYYIGGVGAVFKGGSLDIKDKYSFDFAALGSQAEWDTFLELFWSDAEEFALLVEQLPEEQLDTPFTDEKYGSYGRNIDAMIEHCYYHLGQIVLLRKLLQPPVS